jgi:bla regulator protein BlaR1
MIANSLSAIAEAVGPAIGNHLWQSTFFLAAAGMLMLLLRKNHAQARHAIWLIASAKFLIPFSLLVGLGSRLARTHSAPATNAGAYFAMEEISQPFTQQSIPAISRAVNPTALSSMIHWLPALLAVLWLCGLLAVLAGWCVRWRRISALVRAATRLSSGREVHALRRLERLAATRTPIDIFLSRASIEPGIVGIIHPVLLWPEGMSERLDDAQLETILVHEFAHVCRRDNLAASMHMLVEAIFWFHPLVWWLGARLIDERERACDEQVLQMGSERRVYAESILKTCEFCVGSPLDCVSGVTGADLKKRIVRIMAEGRARKLDFTQKLLLVAAALAVVAVPILFGRQTASPTTSGSETDNAAANTSPYAFEVASIKPDKSGGATGFGLRYQSGSNFNATGVTLEFLIRAAYRIEFNQIIGGPAWINSDRFDIEAKPDAAVAEQLQKLNRDDRNLATGQMIQGLLADRFKLAMHHETRELPEYVLVVAKNGPKIREATPGDTYSNGLKLRDGTPGGPGLVQMSPGHVAAQATTMDFFIHVLEQQLGTTVVDKTGLTGKYDIPLDWAPDTSQPSVAGGASPGPQGPGAPPSPDASGPSVFTAIEDQLGLKLESQKGPVDVLVIDHVEPPSEN